MANPSSNPLLSPPFYVIPGIDPGSPISAQTEQIDQLNTLLLQEIDANFARFHQIVTSKILPEIKRFAIAGEPTREAAQFWRSFFEAAAATRYSGTDDTTLPSTHDTSTQYDDHTMALRREENDSVQPDESGSFIFDPPATSSTPLPNRRSGNGAASRGSGAGAVHESWEDSLGSPFDRMDRKLRDELKIDQGQGEYFEGTSSDMPTPSLPSGYSLPSLLDQRSSDLSSFSQDQDEGHSTGTVDQSQLSHSHTHTHTGAPPAGRPLSATPKASRTHPTSSAASSNPFGASFNGIADLRSTPLNPKSKAKQSRPKGAAAAARPPKTSILPNVELDSSSDEDDFGMSPPVTIKFTLPPTAQRLQDIARTPGKSAPGAAATGENEARFILDDLLEEMGSDMMSPRLDTPEGLGRYSVLPGEIEAGAGRLLFSSSSSGQAAAGPSHFHSHSHSSVPEPLYEHDGGEDDVTYHPSAAAGAGARRSMANTSYGSDVVQVPVNQVYSADDTFDADDSYDSEEDDDDRTGDGQVSIPSHPGTGSSVPYSFNENEGGDISSLSEGDPTTSSEAGAVFGRQPAPGQAHLGHGGPSVFELRKREEMDTYFGGRLEDAAGLDVQTSPTYKR